MGEVPEAGTTPVQRAAKEHTEEAQVIAPDTETDAGEVPEAGTTPVQGSMQGAAEERAEEAESQTAPPSVQKSI